MDVVVPTIIGNLDKLLENGETTFLSSNEISVTDIHWFCHL